MVESYSELDKECEVEHINGAQVQNGVSGSFLGAVFEVMVDEESEV